MNLIALRTFNRYIRKINTRTHLFQLKAEWGAGQRRMWFDRNLAFNSIRVIDCTNYTERIGFSTLMLKNNPKILELGFGDAYAAAHYYHRVSTTYIGVDNDRDSHKFAEINYPWLRGKLLEVDYSCDFPNGEFTNIIWDAGIGYFEEVARARILNACKLSLGENGILSGFVIQKGVKTHPLFSNCPENTKQLKNWLNPYFKNIWIFEKCYEAQTGDLEKYFYFACSNGDLPMKGTD